MAPLLVIGMHLYFAMRCARLMHCRKGACNINTT